MTSKATLMAVGHPPAVATLLGFDINAAMVSSGSNQATAPQISGSCVTVSGTAWFRLPPAATSGPVLVLPTGASTVVGSGADTINAFAAGTGVLLTANKVVEVIPVGNAWFLMQSAT